MVHASSRGLFRQNTLGRRTFPRLCHSIQCQPREECIPLLVYKADDGTFLVHPRHLTTMADGTTKLLKSAEVGFALAEYSHGEDAEPIQLTFVDQCHTNFLQREARLPYARPAARQRRQPAPAQEATQASSTASIRKRRQTPAAQAPPPTPLQFNLRRRS